MSIEEILNKLGLEFQKMRDRRYVVYVDKGVLKEKIKELSDIVNGELYLSNITAIDRLEDNIFELCYNIWIYGKGLVSMRTKIDRSNPVFESIQDMFPGAFAHELEVHDLFGIKFEGVDNLWEPAFKPEDMKGVYPLRKDWKVKK